MIRPNKIPLKIHTDLIISLSGYKIIRHDKNNLFFCTDSFLFIETTVGSDNKLGYIYNQGKSDFVCLKVVLERYSHNVTTRPNVYEHMVLPRAVFDERHSRWIFVVFILLALLL